MSRFATRGMGCARRWVSGVRGGVALAAAAAFVLAAAARLSAAEIERLGPCQPDTHEGLICGSGNGAARVIADTISPSKRLALAWRSPGAPPTEQPDDDEIELLLVRLSDGAVLSTQKGAFWDTGEMRANRRDQQAAWSPDSRLIVETYHSRFSTDSMTVFAIAPGDKASLSLDLLKIMDTAVRAELKRRVRNVEPYELYVQRVAIDRGGRIRALVDLWVPKDGPSATFAVAAAVTRKGDALAARVTSVRRSREKP